MELGGGGVALFLFQIKMGNKEEEGGLDLQQNFFFIFWLLYPTENRKKESTSEEMCV